MSTNPPAPGPRERSGTPRRRPPSILESLRDWRFWLSLVVLFAINFFIVNVLFAPAQPKQVTIPYTIFKAQVAADNVVSITSTGDSITGLTRKPVGPSAS